MCVNRLCAAASGRSSRKKASTVRAVDLILRCFRTFALEQELQAISSLLSGRIEYGASTLQTATKPEEPPSPLNKLLNIESLPQR